ncbi:glycosyltransferase involved in cell wall biosynthesis [Halarchaeum rubridurum]|uniref:Glycosyltransferase involved in cell wall biosynthesis n=1 Tax=Halarchaeum rubridurum TaxID=489911 RepID=A0A830FVI3_9EURY|nr:glycosyltransferase family 2 protein [Halarchaeum rubridurum]MBP1953339.1 glycosyltransferase involved in cell wall biosynthesis [Halarchaeum rubridurum]GGM66094.1 hypothetical protein GCM10009017_15190 [Halarchaeum rubridurum]
MKRVEIPASLRGDGTLVSVIVPTYGDSEYLPKALESVAGQTHDNVEIVVVDSSGVDWLQSLANETDGVRYEYQEPRGLSAARNRAVEIASGDIVAFLDADDWWEPEKLEHQLPEIENGADVVYCDAYIVDGDSTRRMSTLPVEDAENHYLDFLYEGGVPVPTVIARRACVERERFDERLDAVEDFHLLVRLFREYTPARVPEPLAYYNRRSDSMSSDLDAMYENSLQALELLFERYPDLRDHRDRLLADAEYAHAKRLIREGQPAEARKSVVSAIRRGTRDRRAFALLLVSLLPGYNRRAFELLERGQERLR